jgi:hypothetical protein
MANPKFHPRFKLSFLIETLLNSHVALIHGQRYYGITTLTSALGNTADFSYICYDDNVLWHLF